MHVGYKSKIDIVTRSTQFLKFSHFFLLAFKLSYPEKSYISYLNNTCKIFAKISLEILLSAPLHARKLCNNFRRITFSTISRSILSIRVAVIKTTARQTSMFLRFQFFQYRFLKLPNCRDLSRGVSLNYLENRRAYVARLRRRLCSLREAQMRFEGDAEDTRWRDRGAQQRMRDRARRHIYSMGADTLIDFQYSSVERQWAWSVHSHVTWRNARARWQTRVPSPVYKRGQRNDIFARIEITVLYAAIT